MTRSERAQASRGADSRLERWRGEVERLLRDQFSVSERDGERPSNIDYAGTAATIVGMFDAGARDGEVVAFLRHAEKAAIGKELGGRRRAAGAGRPPSPSCGAAITTIRLTGAEAVERAEQPA